MLLGLAFSPHDVAGILAGPDGGAVLALRHDFSPNSAPADQWLAGMELCRSLLGRCVIEPEHISRAGIAFDAPMEAGGIVRRANESRGWGGYDLGRGLREHLRIGNVVAETQCVAQAWGEYHFGSLRNEPNWLYVHLGETVEGSFMSAGRLVRGAGYAAGDLGGTIIEREGAVDSGGRRGSLDAYCGAQAFMGRARSYAITVQKPAEIWDAAASNFAAQSVTEDYVSRLAQGLSGAIALLNPAILCLGGDFGIAIWPKIQGPLQSKICEMAPARATDGLRVIPSTLGEDAASLGAVALALHGAP